MKLNQSLNQYVECFQTNPDMTGFYFRFNATYSHPLNLSGRVSEWFNLGSSTIMHAVDKMRQAIDSILEPGSATNGTSTPLVSVLLLHKLLFIRLAFDHFKHNTFIQNCYDHKGQPSLDIKR